MAIYSCAHALLLCTLLMAEARPFPRSEDQVQSVTPLVPSESSESSQSGDGAVNEDVRWTLISGLHAATLYTVSYTVSIVVLYQS